MCAAQEHRGPDARGMHRSDGVCLGVQRLRIIDLQTGDQPIYNEDGSVAVILNGEIYNFAELRRRLQRRGHRFATNADTEVIAHLYEERGDDLVQELRGMFAFAVWDLRRRRLLLARDRVGKKPLFYADVEGQLSFASELQALMVDDEIPRQLDPSSIDCYLAYGYIPAPWSVWRHVRKLPPAHTLVWEEGRSTTRAYWRLKYANKVSGDPRELEEELRRLVRAAVRRRMTSDVPVGAFLSGGVDSSIVVAEMAAYSPQPVKTFSIGFSEQRYDELPRARVVAERFSTDHREFVVKPDAIEILPRLIRHYGEPYADSSAIPSFYLAELTSRSVTVALNGDGGDESFAGYLRHVANSVTSRLDRLPEGLRQRIAGIARKIPPGADGRGLAPYARRLLVSADRNAVDRYADHVSIFGAQERQSLMDPGFRSSIDPARAQRFIRKPWFTAECDHPLDVLLAVDVSTYLPHDLLVKVDTATMAHSLEARSPLLDQEVMEFAAALPVQAKVALLRKKRLLRRAYAGEVPASTLRGRKRGFAVPLSSWFRGELRDRVQHGILARDAPVRRYFAPGALESTVDQHVSGRVDRSAQIWALLVLSEWHQAERQPGTSWPTGLGIGAR